MDRLETHPFWGTRSPLAHFSYIPFLLVSSTRFSIAIIGSLALIWTYLLSSLTCLAADLWIPKTYKTIISVLISSFWSFLFGFLVNLFSPLLFHELLFLLSLVPVVYIFSELGKKNTDKSFKDTLNQVIIRALVLSGIMLLLSLIREPFGFGSISLPTKEGITAILTSDIAADMSVRIFATTGGGLILLGFVMGFYRIFRAMFVNYYAQKENR